METLDSTTQGYRGPLNVGDVFREAGVTDQQLIVETERRVGKAWKELLRGYSMSAADILSRQFEEPSNEFVSLRSIGYFSTCEHHLLPFFGTVSIVYLPGDGKVVGLSKLARLVECFSRRLQLQERMTREIADSLTSHLGARGVLVVVRGQHLCMMARGVQQQTSEMVTSAVRGAMAADAQARAEALELIR